MTIFKKLRAVRGAVCCENTAESIQKEVCFLFSEVMRLNKLCEKNIISIQFTVTEDVTALNPATALRKNGFANNTALFCSAEPCIQNALPKTIRLLIHYYSRRQPKPVYMHGAEVLRQDITG